MKTLSVRLCSFALADCSGTAKIPPPETSERLRESVCTFYTSETRPGPSGVLVATQQDGLTGHIILTAGHVVKQLIPLHRDSGKCYLGFRSTSHANAVRRICAPSGYACPFLHPDCPVEDLGGFLVKDLETGVKSNSGRVFPIDLDIPFANGVGILRDESDYVKHAISAGTEAFTLCSDITKPTDNLGYDWRDSVIVRTGTIRDLHAKLDIPGSVKRQNAIIVDFPSVNGNSGGPVFAYGLVDGVRYPFLLGVVSGQVGAKTGWTAVAPIGPIVKEIKKELK